MEKNTDFSGLLNGLKNLWVNIVYLAPSGAPLTICKQLPWLKASTVAYLNIDVAVGGPLPDFASTPQLHQLGKDSMKKVPYSLKGSKGTSLYDIWTSIGGEPGVLGSGSDYTAFVHNGIASVSQNLTSSRKESL